MDVLSEIQRWLTLIVDGLNSRCSPFHIMQWISFKSSFSSINVTPVKSCFATSNRTLHVSVCTRGSRCWVTPLQFVTPLHFRGLKIKRHSAVWLLCTVTIALEIQCSIDFERKRLLISSCLSEAPVLTKACTDTEKKEKRWLHPWGFAWYR